MDIRLTDELDIDLENGITLKDENKETTLMAAFFTDKRVRDKRGYWLEVQNSEAWTFEQSRLTEEVAREFRETAKEIAMSLVEDGLHSKINTDVTIDKGVMTLKVQCYDDKKLVLERRYKIWIIW